MPIPPVFEARPTEEALEEVEKLEALGEVLWRGGIPYKHARPRMYLCY